jgi:hypothetical protein
MAVKKNVGKVIGQVQGLRVRQIDQTSTVKGKIFTKSTQIGIFNGKKQIESGFKTKESALLRAKEMVSQIVK